MNETQREILQTVRRLKIDCPACASIGDDDQYTCTTCWNEGGNGKIDVFNWIAENLEAIRKETGI